MTTASDGDDASDSFDVTVNDSDGDSANATLIIAIVDDVPTATDDVDSVDAGSEQGAMQLDRQII